MRAPRPKTWLSKIIKMWAKFRTTWQLDREYLGNETRYRQRNLSCACILHLVTETIEPELSPVLTASVYARRRPSTRARRRPYTDTTPILYMHMQMYTDVIYDVSFWIPIVTTMLYFCRTIFCRERNADVIRDGIGFIGQS